MISKNTQPRNGQTRNGQKAPHSKNNSLKNEIKREIMQSINSQEEEKWINVAGVSVATSGTPTFVDLSTIGQGTTSGTRIGDTIKLNHFRFALSVIYADATNLVRVTIFKWMMNNTSDVPSASEIFQDTTGATRICLTPFVTTKPSRFKIIFDKLINLDATCHPQAIHLVEMAMKTLVSFDTGTSTGRNHIYVSFVSDSTAIPHPAFSYESFVKFHDD